MKFHYDLKSQFKKTDYLLFAYIYPYTYLDHLLSINEVKEKALNNEEIYFDR